MTVTVPHTWRPDAVFRELLTLTGHESYVFSVEFSPHRNSLVSGSFDHSVRVWDCR